MRGVRSTLVLLVVLVGLGAYIYFVESKKEPDAGPKKEKVFTIDASKIDGLKVKSGPQETTLSKSGGSWQIVQPTPGKADESEVSGITSSLGSLEVDRVVDEKPGNLKQYGLADPRVVVAFKAAGEKDYRQLYLGDKTATGGALYAKLPKQPRVFLVSGYLDSTFNRTPFDLRDKTILRFNRDKVDTVAVNAAPANVEFSKAGEDWKMTRPIQATADYSAVEGLVGRLQTAQMKSMVAQDATDLKAYGLDAPEITATVGEGSSRATLLLGKKTPEGTVYAKDAARPAVFTVEASLADDLKKPADDYRRKDLFEARAYNTDSIEVTRGSETLAFAKVKAQGKDAKNATEKWRQVKPAARDVDAAKMDTFLTKLSNLRAQSFVDAKATTGLNAPVAAVIVKFGDGGAKEEKVTFGRAGSDVYAARASEPGAAKLTAADFDDAMKALDALK